jgi:hypothetical protein
MIPRIKLNMLGTTLRIIVYELEASERLSTIAVPISFWKIKTLQNARKDI